MKSCAIPLSALSLLALVFAPALQSQAALDPLVGTKVSLVATQAMLASPFLPSLSSTGTDINFSGSYILTKMEGGDSASSYNGRFSGYALGLGYSSGTKGYLGTFAIVNASSMDGEVHMGDGSGAAAGKLEGFKMMGYAAMGGGSLRIFGSKNSKFALGVFAGPGLMYFDSSFKVTTNSYSSNPLIYGGFGGAQVKIILGDFMFNPYYIYFTEMGNECKQMKSNVDITGGPGCGGNPSALKLPATFGAFGLIMGYKKLSANVYAKLMNDKSLDDISALNLSLSYTF